jgi:hypothetical protein
LVIAPNRAKMQPHIAWHGYPREESTMSATAIFASQKSAHKPARRLLVRMNATLFHCLGAAVLLEHAAAAGAARMPGVQSNGIHGQERQDRAQWLRDYAASIWPEFAWDAACASIGAVPASHGTQPFAHANAVVESDHMALFYRALSAIAEDAELCRVLRQIASIEENRRDGMTTNARPGVVGAFRSAQSTRAYVEHARNRVVRRAFGLLQQHWIDTPPFPASDYDVFLVRSYALLAPHLRLDWTRRLLYRGWLTSRASRAPRSTAVTCHAQNADTGMRMHEFTVRPACALPHASLVR